ncbi:MAG: WD40 repeat domain-containing protein [Shewanella sp.]|nr:WD40 repeat domain-containing protein [Shewanella sp.]MCF1430037.1 WD40 repeat domain-containing protein [Shewanella sp.]MCF1438658.1 WD40 repeat domain-containing protein [Shewanella sp.]MCF1458870.1 WD40 repeat domain-containing protein [Shewanella sp.]
MHKLLLVITVTALSACQPKPAQEVITLTQEPLYAASLTQDGNGVLLSTSDSGLLYRQLSETGAKYQWRHGDNNSDIIETAISPSASYAASLSLDSVALWSIVDGQSRGWWSLPAAGQSVAVADNGALLIGLADGSVMSLTGEQDKLIKFLGHSEKVNSVAISADGRQALSGGNDNKVILWDAGTGQPEHNWQLASRVIKVTLSDDGAQAFASDSTNDARIWSSHSGDLISQLDIRVRQKTFSAARFVESGNALLTGTPAREVILWRTDNGKKLGNWQVAITKKGQINSAVVYSVATKGADQVLSVSSNGLLEAWSLTSTTR